VTTEDGAILVGLGGNLPSRLGPPQATLRGGLAALAAAGVAVAACSPFYSTAPVPASAQPRFVNAVARLETALAPAELLALLLRLETALGRVRGERWSARTLDLDLLAYGRMCGDWPAAAGRPALTLPHPRMHERAFVLRPLADLLPAWRHPLLALTAAELLARLPDDGSVRLPGETP